MRPKKNIEVTDKTPYEEYQNNKPDDKNYDKRYQIQIINKKKIIDDE